MDFLRKLLVTTPRFERRLAVCATGSADSSSIVVLDALALAFAERGGDIDDAGADRDVVTFVGSAAEGSVSVRRAYP